jgi:hypothetical protein
LISWETPPESVKPPPQRDYTALLQELNVRLQMLETERMSWWLHWRDLAAYILPRRYKWLVTQNQTNKGSPINQLIIDETGSVASRVLAAGMMSGITSPSRPWFRMQMQVEELNDIAEVKVWCDDVAKRMQMVMANSNYYTAKAVQYYDLSVFGTAPMLIYEDTDNIIRCYNPCAGEYYAANGPAFTVDSFYRKIAMTVSQVAGEFGEDALSSSSLALLRTPGGKDREIIICHSIEPNPDFTDGLGVGRDGLPKRFRYREVFWEWGTQENKVLRLKGYYEQPFGIPRWDLVGNDPYGRSPGMDALPSIRQLQLESKRKAQALDKMVNPPMKAGPGMKNQPMSLLPGAVTFTNQQDDVFAPVYEAFNPPIEAITADIQDVRERIKQTFFNDLFMMISQLDTVRTATEIDARREEKLIQLGPVLERFQNEGLAPDIERIFAIMQRKGLLPPAPPQIRGMPVKVVYDSMLSQMQRAAQTGSIERLWATVGNLAAAVPDVLDLLNYDEGVDEYADMLGVSPKLLNDPAKVQALRKAKQQQAQQQAAMQQSLAMAQGAQTMSQTPVGGGQNALQAVLQGAQ